MDGVPQHTNGMADLITNADVEQVVNPQRYYDWLEYRYKELMKRSNDLKELWETSLHPEWYEEWSDLEWQAMELTYDNEPFLSNFIKDNPKTTNQFY